MAPGGSWAAVGGVVSPTSTTFRYTVDEDVTGKALRAVVTYRDRRGPGKTAQSNETAAVTADPIINAPPRFRGGSTWSVEEGDAGRAVGVPTSATDRDNDRLTYGIESSLDSEFFEINPSTGQVRTAEALDFETTSGLLSFVITLHDGEDADGNPETNPVIDATRSATAASPVRYGSGRGPRTGRPGGPTFRGPRQVVTRRPKPMRTSTCVPASPTRTGAAARARRESLGAGFPARTGAPSSHPPRPANAPCPRTPGRTSTSARRWPPMTRRMTG